MKNILCYGDSNTFGFITENFERFGKLQRWSGILSALLNEKYNVIEEGLCDRNGFVKNPKGSEFCALENLSVCLDKYKKIDLLILAIGTNDLQFTYNFNEEILKEGLAKLINTVKDYNKETKIIIVPPVKLEQSVVLGCFNSMFNETSVKRSNETFYLYKKIAKENNCYYFDFNEIVKPSPKDGLHYELKSHKFIAEKLAEYINCKKMVVRKALNSYRLL